MADYPDWFQLFQLVGTDITLNINIEATDITLPISIDAATVTLDINIHASDIDINIIFTDQSVAVFDVIGWAARQGQQKFWYGHPTIGISGTQIDTLYTVPEGKVLYVTRCIWSSEQEGCLYLRFTSPLVYVAAERFGRLGQDVIDFGPPVVIAAGKSLQVTMTNEDTVGGRFIYTVSAYELDV